jgi:hypothetical protein
MNELVNRNTALPANFGENLMKGIAETRSTMTVSDGGKPLLRLLKQGQWVYGPNNEPVENGCCRPPRSTASRSPSSSAWS